MTRKDYVNIAAAILATQTRIKSSRTLQWKDEQDNQLRGVRCTAAHICEFLAEDNPRFDKGQFLTACGYGPMTMNPRDPALDLRPLPESISIRGMQRDLREFDMKRRPIAEGLEDRSR